MLLDASVPQAASPPRWRLQQKRGVVYRSAVWDAAAFARLAETLAARQQALRDVDDAALLRAWEGTIDEFLDRRAAIRRALEGPLVRLGGLSQPGLEAALETVLQGVRTAALERAAATVAQTANDGRRAGLVVVFLSSNLPGLAVQPLLPALLRRCPVLLKSPSSEPLFAAAFVDALCRREPRLRSAVAALTWSGGETHLEAPLLAAAQTVIAYGGEEAMRDLAARAGDKLLAFGPKMSLAIIDSTIAPEAIAEPLAADIALFDQRGCLSIQAIYTSGSAPHLAAALSAALDRMAQELPPGELDPHLAAQVRQIRAESEMRGLQVAPLALRSGTVVVEPGAELQPSPGLRTVRIYPVADLAGVPERLAPWAGRLQGVALAGAEAQALAPELRRLGASRLTAPGRLQAVDAGWENGGISLLAQLA